MMYTHHPFVVLCRIGPALLVDAGFFIFGESKMNRASFFIDGFNVFHSLDCNKSYYKYKWLDYSVLAKCFITSKDTIADIYYFTA